MARAYSLDLRERVVAMVARGGTCRSVAAVFEVSVASVVKWSQRARTTGGHDQSQEEKPQYQWRPPKNRHGKRAKTAIEHGYLKSWSSLNLSCRNGPKRQYPASRTLARAHLA